MFITVSTAVTYDKYLKAIRVKVPNSDEEFLLHPATVRRNDRSAQSVVWKTFNSRIRFALKLLFFVFHLKPEFIVLICFILVKQDEWTGEQKVQFGDVAEDIEPEEIRPMGNYAVSITWPDGFSQV